MDSTLAIIISAVSCFGGSSYITYRCYCNEPEIQNEIRSESIIVQRENPVMQRQPTPPLEHALKEIVNNMRDSNESDTLIDIKIHVQSHKD
jgi:hypothetical protein